MVNKKTMKVTGDRVQIVALPGKSALSFEEFVQGMRAPVRTEGD
jgi:hypothetical protein